MPQQALLVRTLVELAGGLVADFDVVDLLTLLADRCVEALDVGAAGVMVANPGAELQVVASSSEAMRTLELFQLQSDQGPCVDAYRSGQPVINQDLAANLARWPRFSPQAIGAGFCSTHSLPMQLRGRVIGALNLFRADNGALGSDDVSAAQALADVATIVIVQHRALANTQVVNDQLTRALNSRVIIEQAKGRIGEATSVDMDSAFRRLRHHARNHNLRLTDLAEEVVTGKIKPASLDPLGSARRRS